MIGQRQYKTAESSQNRVITVTKSCEGRTTTACKQIYLVHGDVTWPLAFRVLEGTETILFFFSSYFKTERLLQVSLQDNYYKNGLNMMLVRPGWIREEDILSRFRISFPKTLQSSVLFTSFN